MLSYLKSILYINKYKVLKSIGTGKIYRRPVACYCAITTLRPREKAELIRECASVVGYSF